MQDYWGEPVHLLLLYNFTISVYYILLISNSMNVVVYEGSKSQCAHIIPYSLEYLDLQTFLIWNTHFIFFPPPFDTKEWIFRKIGIIMD